MESSEDQNMQLSSINWMLCLPNLIRSDQNKVDTDCETSVSEWTIYVNIFVIVHLTSLYSLCNISDIVLKREKGI